MRPILFYIGRLPIRAYGTMMMLAFAAGIAWAVREARRRSLDPGLILDLAVWIMVSGIVFARAVFIALDPALTWRDLPYIWRGGLSFHGGLIGGVLAALVFVRLKRIRFWTLADTCAPSIALAYGIARIGCLLAQTTARPALAHRRQEDGLLAQAGQVLGHVARAAAVADVDGAGVTGAHVQRVGGVALRIQPHSTDDQDVTLMVHTSLFPRALRATPANR